MTATPAKCSKVRVPFGQLKWRGCEELTLCFSTSNGIFKDKKELQGVDTL